MNASKIVSTLEVDSAVDLTPPSITRVPLVSQHAWLLRESNKKRTWPPLQRHQISQLVNTPRIMSPVIVPGNSLAHVFANTHTSISRHASTSPRFPATIAKEYLGERGSAVDGPVEYRDGDGACQHGVVVMTFD